MFLDAGPKEFLRGLQQESGGLCCIQFRVCGSWESRWQTSQERIGGLSSACPAAHTHRETQGPLHCLRRHGAGAQQGSSPTVACAGNDHIPSMAGSFLPSPGTLMSSDMWFATQLSEAQRAFVGRDGQSWTVPSPRWSLWMAFNKPQLFFQDPSSTSF